MIYIHVMPYISTNALYILNEKFMLHLQLSNHWNLKDTCTLLCFHHFKTIKSLDRFSLHDQIYLRPINLEHHNNMCCSSSTSL